MSAAGISTQGEDESIVARPATIAAPASATQVVNSEEPILFARARAQRPCELSVGYTSFRPFRAIRRHKTRASLASLPAKGATWTTGGGGKFIGPRDVGINDC
jgi:hypothetical protein